MITLNCGLETPIVFGDRTNVLIIEKPNEFYKFVSNIKGQANGEDGDFMLFDEKHNETKFSNAVEVISDATDFSINSKKVQTVLYKKLGLLMNEDENILKFSELNSKAVNLLDELAYSSGLELEYESSMECVDLLKTYGVKFKEDYDSLLDKFVNFVNVISSISKIKLLCLVNLKAFMNNKEIKELLKQAKYQDLNILLVESTPRKCEEGESVRIIDEDLCEIIIEK